MGLVIEQGEIGKIEIKNGFDRGIELHAGQGIGFSFQLQAGLLEMIAVEMGIAEADNKFAGLKVTHLRHHQGEQGVRGDVEGQTKEDIGRTLIELTG